MKKILLAGGCSYTDPNFKSSAQLLPDHKRGGWPMWPELMGKQLDLEVINTALAGVGNKLISKTIISNIIKYGDQIDTVAVLWTSPERIELYNQTIFPLIDLSNPGEMADYSHKYSGLNVFKWPPKKFKEHKVYETWIKDSLLAMYEVAEVCKVKNIKCVFGQGVCFLLYQTAEAFLNIIKTHPNKFDPTTYQNIESNIHLSKKSFVDLIFADGIYQELRKRFSKNFFTKYDIFDPEYAIDTQAIFYKNRKKYRIADTDVFATLDADKNDHHPNAEGQKYIADAFLQDYKK